MRPLIVLDDPAAAGRLVDTALEGWRRDGWRIVDAWVAPHGDERLICRGAVRSDADARQALLAALAGAGLVIIVAVERAIADQLLDDLRRLGPVDHVTTTAALPARLSADERALLALLADGLTLGAAAVELGLSRRTADRRLATARRTLGVRTTAEAIVASRR